MVAACEPPKPREPAPPERHLHGDVPLRLVNQTGVWVCDVIVVERLGDGELSDERERFVDAGNAIREEFHRDYSVKPGRYRVKARTCARRGGEIQYERAFDLDVEGPTKLVLLPRDKPEGAGADLPSKRSVYKKASKPQPAGEQKCIPLGGECSSGTCRLNDSTHGCHNEINKDGQWTGRMVCMRNPGS